MSREIKFRVWNTAAKAMYPANHFAIRASDGLFLQGMDHIGDDFNNLTNYRKAYQETLRFMQYTGLKDRNGVEIYEGDIMTTYRLRQVAGVQWSEYQGRWMVGVRGLNRANAVSNAVVGNIYENPELLRSKS